MKNLGYSCLRGHYVGLPWFSVAELQFFIPTPPKNAMSSYFQVNLLYFLVDSSIRCALISKQNPEANFKYP